MNGIDSNLRALVVDDDFASCSAVCMFISRYMPCAVASNGREAVEAVAASYSDSVSSRFDLIIMDIMMPDTDGLEAVASIRQLERKYGNEKALIIMATALDDDVTMLRALHDSGADDFFVKPIRFEELRRSLVRYEIIEPEKRHDLSQDFLRRRPAPVDHH